jgi:hypothetical protein
MSYREKSYHSLDDFRFRETPTFDHLSDAIDGLMDALFLDEVNRDYGPHRGRHDGDEERLFDDPLEAEWAY